MKDKPTDCPFSGNELIDIERKADALSIAWARSLPGLHDEEDLTSALRLLHTYTNLHTAVIALRASLCLGDGDEV